MGPLSLGRPKWEGATWTKGAHRWRPPPWRAKASLGETLGRPPPREETLGRTPRGCPLLQGGCPPPPPINSGGGGTRFTHNRNCSLPKGCPLLLPLIRLDLISTIDSNCCSSLLSLLRRRRALDGGALPDLPHRTCGSTIERSCVRPLFEGSRLDQDLFVGLTWWPRSVRGRVHLHASPTLHRVFRCKRSATVERLQEGKLDRTSSHLHLPRSVLGFDS